MTPERDPDPYRLYAIVRTDLAMAAGKIAAQSGHAFLDSFLKASEQRPDTIQAYKQNHGIKVVLGCPSLKHLMRAYHEALDKGIPCELITDLGYTQFNNIPTITALGLGPARRSEVDTINRNFDLL